MNQYQYSDFNSVKLVTVDEQSADRRLDNFLISLLRGVPHSHVYNLIRTGQVRVNRGRAKASTRLDQGDIVRIPPVVTRNRSKPGKFSPVLERALQRVVFEDESLLVLDKPAGVAVHSGTRHNFGLIEALRQVRQDGNNIELVHRLDKDTSGVLVLAKSHRVLRHLQNQWRRDSHPTSLRKHYCALLKNHWPDAGAKRIESEPRKPKKKFKSHQQSVGALSIFSPVRNFQQCVLVDIELHTGKTHQARQHAQEIGHPIAGDRKYGDLQFNQNMFTLGLKRMFLHASRIELIHPTSERLITVEVCLPTELTSIIDRLENQEKILQ